MSEPLTQEHFDETMRAIADTLGQHGTQFAAILDTPKDHTKRLDRIELEQIRGPGGLTI